MVARVVLFKDITSDSAVPSKHNLSARFLSFRLLIPKQTKS